MRQHADYVYAYDQLQKWLDQIAVRERVFAELGLPAPDGNGDDAIEYAKSVLRTRQEIAAFLSKLGFKTSPKTLAKDACIGGGPKFQMFGAKPLYSAYPALLWAFAKTSPALGSTSDAQHPKGFRKRAAANAAQITAEA